jgi:hypothetical protein
VVAACELQFGLDVPSIRALLKVFEARLDMVGLDRLVENFFGLEDWSVRAKTSSLYWR